MHGCYLVFHTTFWGAHNSLQAVNYDNRYFEAYIFVYNFLLLIQISELFSKQNIS